ncbi:MAG TPA: DUF1801 domain-containing protein [Thermoanaerobaculia bacterium]|nr:DUF1801 domain-containing protein [Thermoanaerobaculia bacterium]
MAEPKTKKTDASVEAFLDAVADPGRREDARAVLALMKRITGEEPKMWGPSIVGFGSYTYTYASGRTGDWPIAGFSPRKQALTLYVMPGFEKDADLMKRLGKHKTGKSCLYLNRLADVDAGVLEELVRRSVERMRNRRA